MPPNILFILTDDQPRSTAMRNMPKLKANLIDRGTNFRRGYTSVPLCGPARVSLLPANGCITIG